MNLRDLQYLVAVADLQHFGKAAQACHVSQPTLSGQIKKLEEEWGVQCFERTNRRVMPTQEGLAMIAIARRILQGAAEMKELAQRLKDPLAGSFRLGAFPTLAPYLFPSLTPAIVKALPQLRLILIEEKTEHLLAALQQGELDAALLALPLPDAQFASLPLFEDPFFLAVPRNHALAQQASISLDALANTPLLLLDEGHCLREQALEVCHLHRLRPDADVRATSLETLRQMVRVGTGITLLPESALMPDDPSIAVIAIDEKPTRTIGLVWRHTSARLPVIQAIVQQFD
jgi:LysR family transcriptional regulator, hydrogen peroxide-inducible genes activator